MQCSYAPLNKKTSCRRRGDRIGRDFRQQKDLLVTCIEGEGV